MRVMVGPGRSDALVERLRSAGADDISVWEGPGAAGGGSPSDVLLLHGPVPGALSAARRAHSADAAVQMGLVVEPARRAEAERALLFAPGLGEIWLLSPDDVGRDLLNRAAEVTAQRRRYRSLRERLAGDVGGIEPLHRQRAIVSDRYLASLLQALTIPVLSLDSAGRLVSWNPATEAVLQRTPEELAHGPLQDALNPPDAGAFAEALQRAERGEDAVEIRFTRGGGGEGIGDLSIRSVDIRDHDIRVAVINDVTEQRLARQELEAQAQELEAQAAQLQDQAAEMEMLNESLHERTRALEEALASRSRFYAAMSHELRTPMNAIIGYNALLLDEVFGQIPPVQVQALERSQRAARHLLELVNDVLDISKIEAGRLNLHPEEARFPELVEDLAETVRPMAEKNGSALVLVHGSEPHVILTDPRRVRQILLNLLSNAIKFGDGSPVRLSWARADDGGIRVEVEDHGRGIPIEEQERIFEEFVQVGDEGGTGLGLPISKRLAEALGGRIELRSQPGAGSLFRLLLPPALPAPPSDGAQG